MSDDVLTGLEITAYAGGDHEALREICIATAARGDDARGRHARPELLPLVYLDPYVVHEPDLVSVLRRSRTGEPVGYVVATADTAGFERRLEREWWPGLRDVYRPDAARLTPHDRELVEHVHAPPATDPALLEGYPAHLHVDLLPEVRGHGWGRALLDRLTDRLREDGVPGVHLEVGAGNTAAQGFYRAVGFEELGRHGHGVTMGRRL